MKEHRVAASNYLRERTETCGQGLEVYAKFVKVILFCLHADFDFWFFCVYIFWISFRCNTRPHQLFFFCLS